MPKIPEAITFTWLYTLLNMIHNEKACVSFGDDISAQRFFVCTCALVKMYKKIWKKNKKCILRQQRYNSGTNESVSRYA